METFFYIRSILKIVIVIGTYNNNALRYLELTEFQLSPYKSRLALKYLALSQEFYFVQCATQWYSKVDFRCVVELWGH